MPTNPPLVRGVQSLALLALASTLAACGSDDGKKKATDSPDAANELAGAYSLVTEVTKSTIKTNKAGPESKLTRALFFSCADADCTQVFQRGPGTGLQSLTVALTRGTGADTLTGSWSTARPCPEDPKDDYSEKIAWSWTRGPDGVLTGTIQQAAAGCKVDGTATYTATATPTPDKQVPYLEAAATDALEAAYTAFDVQIAAARKTITACQDDDEDTITLEDAACDAAFYTTLSKAVTAFGAPLTALQAPTTGLCREAVDKVRAPEWSAKFAALADLSRTAKDVKGLKKAYDQGESSGDFIGKRYDAVLEVAATCINPSEANSMGDNGKLLIDPSQQLVSGS